MLSIDQKNHTLFYKWLLISFCLVFSMIVIGGLTRLTDSGLSITEWELFKGILPPLNLETWENYFSLYKNTPQFNLLFSDMTLDEFKIIFYWEYIHRILGRVIGLFFLLPLIYFYFTKKINKRYLYVCAVIMILILLQGLIGWYMVTSGLVNNTTVSHYRLSLHLVLAVIIISLIFWLILNVKNNSFILIKSKNKNYYFYIMIFLVFLQIIIGAFVSGLDAGKIYQSWPLMNQTFFPDDVSINSVFDLIKFENHSLVQFYHRGLAYLLFFYILLISYLIYKKKMYKLYTSLTIVLSFLFLQVILGIFTLLSNLNIFISSLHQIGSLLLTLSVINLYYRYIN